jgi:hypothetical protein
MNLELHQYFFHVSISFIRNTRSENYIPNFCFFFSCLRDIQPINYPSTNRCRKYYDAFQFVISSVLPVFALVDVNILLCAFCLFSNTQHYRVIICFNALWRLVEFRSCDL